MADARNTVNVPVPGSARFEQDTAMAIGRIKAALGPEASPSFAAMTVAGGAISAVLIGQWNTAYGWGNHAAAGYLTSESDPVFGASVASAIAASDITNWNSAYSGSHAAVTLGSLTGITLTGQQLDLTAGYVIPTTTKETAWDAAASTSHAAVTIPASANGLTLTGQELSLPTTATPTFGAVNIQATTSLAFTGRISDSDLYVAFYTHSNTASHAPLFALVHWRGTEGTPLIAQDGDELGGFVFQGYANGSGRNAAEIRGYADGEWASGGDTSDFPGRLVFLTCNDGAGAPTEKMRISANGNVGIGTLATANELLEVAGKIRANTAFNLNGTDGVTQAASAGKVSDVTALAGGIATAQAQVTPIADGAHNLAGITSITTTNGRITAMT